MPGSKPKRDVHSAPEGEGPSTRVGQKISSNDESANTERRASTEDFFPDNQLGSAHNKFDSVSSGLEALPEEDAETATKSGREGIRWRGKRSATAHQRSMASQAAREFAEDALKGYDVE